MDKKNTELNSKPGDFFVPVEHENPVDRDIIKTHLFYLQRLDGLTDRERGYFYNSYFPYLEKVYNTPDIVELQTINGFQEPIKEPHKKPETPGVITEEFTRLTHEPLKKISLRYLPEIVESACIAKGYTEKETGKSWKLAPLVDFTVDYSTGILTFGGVLDNGRVFGILGISSKYVLFIDYIPVKPSAVYQVGEDGE